MKILFLCNRFPFPILDGGALANFNMLLGLQKAGVSVTLICFDTSKHPGNPEKAPLWLKNLEVESIPLNTHFSLPGFLAALITGKNYLLQRFYKQNLINRVQQLATKESFHLIHLEGIYMAQYAPYLKALNIPLVFREHNVEYQIWERLAQNASLIKALLYKQVAKDLRKTEIRLWQSVNGLVALSQPDLETIKQHTSTAAISATIGIDLTSYEPQAEPIKPNTLFHLAAMGWQPNIEATELLINEYWPAIRSALPHFSLHLAGKNMPEHFLTQSHAPLFIEAEVENAAQWMAPFQFMLVPLISGSGIRVKIIEAMAMGKIVIGSKVAFQGIDIKNGIHGFVVENPSACVAVLKDLELNDEKRIKISKAARNFAVEHFNLEANTKKVIQFYKQIANAAADSI